MVDERAEPFIDFMFVADRAEAFTGKLYIMGGCWERIQVPGLPALHSMGVAVRVVIPAGDSTPEHTVAFAIEGPGEPTLTLNGVGIRRPAGPADAREQAIVAAPFSATFTEAGRHILTATLNGADRKEWAFEVAVTPV